MKKGGKRAMITPKQKKKVWAVTWEKGYSEEHLREIVARISGRRSVKALTKAQAKKVIDVLEGKTAFPAPRDNSKVIALATPGQLFLIEKLRTEADWAEEHLMNFIARYKRNSLRKLRRSEAGVVIKVLKAAKQKKREVA
jgi:hypothetical protein